MNYAEHYQRLVVRAQARASTKEAARAILGYVERHRIVPGCMGGEYVEGNIAYLSGAEHYVAHQLLAKMHPGVHGIVVAAYLLSRYGKGNKAYTWIRKLGAPKSPEHRAKIGAGRKGKGLGPLSEDRRRKMSEAHIGKTQSEEHRRKRGLTMIGNKHGLGVKHPPRSPEWIAKQSAAQKAAQRKPKTPEHLANIAAARKARSERLAAEKQQALMANTTALRGHSFLEN